MKTNSAPNTDIMQDCVHPPDAIRVFLGGSFDPVHIGHTAILRRVYHTLHSMLNSNIDSYNNYNRHSNNLYCIDNSQKLNNTKHAEKVKIKATPKLYASFLPTSRSPLKTHSTASTHRLTMLQHVCVDTPFTICDIEINRPAPSYTIDTLRLLRKLYPNDALIFVLGADSLMNLSLWKDGLSLTDYSHLWVLPRGGLSDHSVVNKSKEYTSLAFSLPELLQQKVTHNCSDLKNTLCGHIYIDESDIMSLSNRRFFYINSLNSSCLSFYKPMLQKPTLLKPNVIKLPIPVVSSSDIRASIATLNFDYARANLKPTVLTYIIEHGLYSKIDP